MVASSAMKVDKPVHKQQNLGKANSVQLAKRQNLPRAGSHGVEQATHPNWPTTELPVTAEKDSGQLARSAPRDVRKPCPSRHSYAVSE